MADQKSVNLALLLNVIDSVGEDVIISSVKNGGYITKTGYANLSKTVRDRFDKMLERSKVKLADIMTEGRKREGTNAVALANLSPELAKAVSTVNAAVDKLDEAIVAYNMAHPTAKTSIWLQTAWMSK